MQMKTTSNEREKTLPLPLISLFKVSFWLLALLFLAQIVFGFVSGLFFEIFYIDENSTDGFSEWTTNVPTILMLLLLSPIINIPLLMKATPAKGWKRLFDFWAIKKMKKQELMKWLLASIVFWVITSMIGQTMNLPAEQFMLDIKAAGNSVGMMVLISFTLCVIIPIMEELIFRGWLFTKVAQTKLGNIGALILTAIIFTIIHSQYENSVTFIMLLFFGLLLGYTRYKSNNISYSIAIHILFNSLAIMALFLQSKNLF